MPDMRDAIAQYLASGRGQQQMPRSSPSGFDGQAPGGLPGMVGGQQQMPPPPPPAPGGVPANLQGFQQLPSGQFMPPTPQAPPLQAPPPVPDNLQGFQQTPAGQFMPNEPPPVPTTPPVDTPMQAPQVGGMDPAEWYRMYTGGR